MNLWLLRLATHIFAFFAGDALLGVCSGDLVTTQAGAAGITILFLCAIGGAFASWAVVDKKIGCYDPTF